MFVNISPSLENVNESLSSLGFAQRCRKTELGVSQRVKTQSKPNIGSEDSVIMNNR